MTTEKVRAVTALEVLQAAATDFLAEPPNGSVSYYEAGSLLAETVSRCRPHIAAMDHRAVPGLNATLAVVEEIHQFGLPHPGATDPWHFETSRRDIARLVRCATRAILDLSTSEQFGEAARRRVIL